MSKAFQVAEDLLVTKWQSRVRTQDTGWPPWDSDPLKVAKAKCTGAWKCPLSLGHSV